MMHETLKRVVKNIVIVLLLISLLVLTAVTWFGDMLPDGLQKSQIVQTLYSGILGDKGEGGEVYTGYREYNYTMSILSPIRAMVRSQGELSSLTVRSDVRELFERTAALLASALSSAEERQELSVYRWHRLLSGDMVLFDFEGEMPLAMLSAVIGSEEPGVSEPQVRYIALGKDGDLLTLAMMSKGEKPVSYKTGVSAAEFAALLREFEGGNAYFAYEDARAAQVLPDLFLVDPDLTSQAVIRSYDLFTDYTSTSTERTVNTVLSGFGFNPYTAGGYIEADDTRVFVEEFHTLRIAPSGAVSYFAPRPEDAAAGITESSVLISSAAYTLDRVAGSYIGDVSIYISRAFFDAMSGRYVILFGCESDGTILTFDDGYFARLEYIGNELVSAHLTLSDFELTEQRDELIPPLQAAAAAGRSSLFELRYAVGQSGEYHARWFSLAD